MDVFRRLLVTAVLAGLLAGLFVTVVHQVATVPVILQAEVYEKAADAAAEKAAPPPAAPTDSNMAAMSHDAADGHHDHDASAWEPQDGIERTAFTVVADVLTGIGFSLLLAAGFAFRGGAMDWRKGLYWGLAGFAVFSLAPGLGLPPEVPGTEAAPLLQRQIWWVATALLTGGGLALIFLGRRAALAVLGIAFLVLPQAYGAPRLAEAHSAAPEALARQFIVAATMASLLFWVVLGSFTGFFYQRQFKAG
jgi:cobalt transporter subunit CbtA